MILELHADARISLADRHGMAKSGPQRPDEITAFSRQKARRLRKPDPANQI